MARVLHSLFNRISNIWSSCRDSVAGSWKRILPGSARAVRISRSGIDIVQSHVDRGNHALESAFLELGQCLEPLSDQMTRLLDARQQLADLASGRIEGKALFEEAVEFLHRPLSHIDDLNSKHTELLELLSRCEERTGAMLRFQQEIRDILAPLSYVEVLFKVESASLGRDDSDTFFAVSDEIARMRHRVDETFEANYESLLKAHKTLAQVHRRQSREFVNHSELIASKRMGIDQSIGRLDDALSRNSHFDFHTKTLSDRLAERIGELVSALQMQDIVKQKCDHIMAGLSSLRSHQGMTPRMVDLAVNQLESVRKDVSNSSSTIGQGLDGVIEQALEIERFCMCQDGFDGMIASADGMVQILLDALSETEGIIEVTNSLITESHEAAAPAREVVLNISAALVELSINMRLIAINAQIRSAQVAEGTGLSTLAAHTAEISNSITRIGEKVAVDIDELRSDMKRMFELFDEFERAGQQHAELLDSESDTVKARLHRLRDRTLDVFNSIGEVVSAVQTASNMARGHVSRVPESSGDLSRAQDILERLKVHLGSSDSGKLSKRELEHMARQADRYSMSSERQIHDRTMREIKEATGSSGEDHGKNRSPRPCRVQATTHGSETPANRAAAPSEYGANVELF